MRLSLHCVGGFTGPAGAQTHSVDVDSLPAADAARVRGLLQRLDLAQLPPTLLKARPQPWDFTYTLAVDGRQVRFHLDAAPPALRELVEAIEQT